MAQVGTSESGSAFCGATKSINTQVPSQYQEWIFKVNLRLEVLKFKVIQIITSYISVAVPVFAKTRILSFLSSDSEI